MPTRAGFIVFAALFAVSCLYCATMNGQNRPSGRPQSAPTLTFKYIDVHSHLVCGRQNDYAGAVDAAAAIIKETGIKKLVVMPPPAVEENSAGVIECDSYIPAFKKYPGQFAFVGGGGTLNVMIHKAAGQTKISDDLRRQFEKKADEILKSGAIGFGEIAIQHLSLHNARHPFESVAGDHPLLLLLADIAAKNDVPIDIHCDIIAEDMKALDWMQVPPNPKNFTANLAGFERLLEHNPKARICWEHLGSDNTGQWTVELSRKMLEKHPNLYMALRMGPGNTRQNFPFSPDGQLRPEWLKLFQDFPTRFMIGSDQFFMSEKTKDSGGPPGISDKVPLSRDGGRRLLSALPEDLAKKIGYENAAAFYKLKD